MKKELRFISARELRVQTSPDGSRTIGGYAAVYNEPSVGLPWIEKVAPGAFADALKPNSDVLCLRDHKQEILLGRTTSRTLILSEDEVGLRFECKLPNTTQASDLAESIERGDLSGVSFTFASVKGGDTWTRSGAGDLIRTLSKVTLYEVSPCSFPAYPSTSVSLRSCPPELRSLVSSEDEDDEEDGCTCECTQCTDGDCAACSNPDCDDEDCAHGEDYSRSVCLWQLKTRLAIAKRR
jgi:HK97 family phage prohead protease